MTAEEQSIVLALARCGMACNNPTAAFIHQAERLKSILDAAGASRIDALLAWHRNGCVKSTDRVIQSNQRIKH